MTFPSVEAYREFWRAHPAFAAGEWTDDVDDYVDYDLEPVGGSRRPDQGDTPCPPGPEPGPAGETVYRSRVSEDAVRADGRDLLDGDSGRKALHSLADPCVLLWAARGLQNEERPLLPAETIADARALLQPGVGGAVDQDELPAGPAGGVAGGGHRHDLVPLAVEDEDGEPLLLQPPQRQGAAGREQHRQGGGHEPPGSEGVGRGLGDG